MQLIFLFFCLVFFNTPQAFPNEKSAPNELTLARQYHEKKQFGKAIQHYLLAAKTQNKKEKTEAYFRLALCYYDVGNWDRAIEAFEQSKETGKEGGYDCRHATPPRLQNALLVIGRPANAHYFVASRRGHPHLQQ